MDTIYDLLTESYGYGDIARRIAILGSISFFAFVQVVRAFVHGRISGFEPIGKGREARSQSHWRRWERREGSEFWLIVGLYVLATVGTATLAFRQLPDLSAAAEPTNLSALQSSQTIIQLSWSSPEREVSPSCYVIYRDERPLSARPANATEIARCNSTSFSDRDFERGKTYYYRIAASFRWEDLSIGEQAIATTQ